MAQTKPSQERARNMKKILIVDDHPLVRRGLAVVVNDEEDLHVCGEAADAPDARKLARVLRPDMAIVDISLANSSGLDLMKDLQSESPELLILALSMHDESVYAERALRAGAKGYITKEEATEEVVTAIRQILSGRVYISDQVAGKLVSRLQRSEPGPEGPLIGHLSDRELEVFSLIGDGHGTREIAERLHVGIKTVETYRVRLKEKLDLASGSDLLRTAIEWGRGQSKA